MKSPIESLFENDTFKTHEDAVKRLRLFVLETIRSCGTSGEEIPCGVVKLVSKHENSVVHPLNDTHPPEVGSPAFHLFVRDFILYDGKLNLVKIMSFAKFKHHNNMTSEESRLHNSYGPSLITISYDRKERKYRLSPVFFKYGNSMWHGPLPKGLPMNLFTNADTSEKAWALLTIEKISRTQSQEEGRNLQEVEKSYSLIRTQIQHLSKLDSPENVRDAINAYLDEIVIKQIHSS
jgi:hypothetical protein